ncbi:hypothetical protein SteCoe_35960 [Stentor coeruleus]|uniref:EF-hand domain-containing protein n=1 Tax=Stentor coeruleus TaxID=5963 RepID=A0A1R2AR80_9CILI|nr:hypothetical protein SteCoe_35960 [Stentor coeruleus]
MENIGTLRDFLGSAEEYTSKFASFTNESYDNTVESRNNTPSPYHMKFRKMHNYNFSLLKNNYHIALADKTKESSQPTLVKPKIKTCSLTDNKSSITTRPQTYTPDYSRVKSKVNSIRKQNEKNYSKPKASFYDKVRNEILLKKGQIILRTMNQTMRSDEKEVSINKPKSDAGFIRLAERMKRIKNEPKIFSQKKNSQDLSIVVQKSNYAKKKNAMISQTKWLKNHGSLDKQSFSPIAKQIMEMLDPLGYNEICVNEFISFLIEIGLPLPVKAIKYAIKLVLRIKDNKNKTLKEEHILALCRGDKRSCHILMIINQEIAKNFNKSIDDVTSVDQEGIICSWWKNFGCSEKKIVQCIFVYDFLVKMTMFAEACDARKFVLDVCKDGGFLDYTQFRSLFARALIKHLLNNINKKFTEEDWENPYFTYSYKLCQLKKQLILAGIKYPIPNISSEEGTLVLRAIESMEFFFNGPKKKVTYEEFKKIWLNDTGITLDTKNIERSDFTTFNSQKKLAVFYTNPEKISLFDDEFYREELQNTLRINAIKTEKKQLLDKVKKSNLGYLLYEKLARGAIFKSVYKRILKPINKDEVRCANQTVILDNFQKIINTIIE